MDIFAMISLLNKYPKGIEIRIFKDHFDPINLADHLKTYEKTGLITIDWKKKKIYKAKEDLFEQAFLQKTQLAKKQVKIPSYMKVDKLETNKPFIPKGGE